MEDKKPFVGMHSTLGYIAWTTIQPTKIKLPSVQVTWNKHRRSLLQETHVDIVQLGHPFYSGNRTLHAPFKCTPSLEEWQGKKRRGKL
jgi:ribosomal protein L31